MVVIKILKRSFLEVLSICKILGTAILLLLTINSEGITLNLSSASLNRDAKLYYSLNDGSDLNSRLIGEYGFVLNSIFGVPTPSPSNVTACAGSSAVFSASSGSTYQWDYSPDGGKTWIPRAEITQTLILLVTSSMNGYIYHCLIDAAVTETFSLTVNPAPAVTNPATASICSGKSPNISLTSSVPCNFAWTIGTITGGITGASSGSGPTINQVLTNSSNSISGTVQYVVTPTSVTGTCAGIPYTITVTVNPDPTVTNTATAIICSGTSPNISLTSSIPSTFTWTIGTITGGITGASSGSGSTIDQVLTNPSNVLAGSVEYQVTPTSVTGTCAGTPYTITVTVNPAPAVTNAVTSTICSGTSPNFALTASVPSTFTWTIGTITGGITGASSGSGSVINQTLTNPSNSISGTVQYLVRPTSVTGTCAGTPYTITVTVNPAPAVTNPATASICSGKSPNISLTSSVPCNFAWTIGTITGGITGASSGSGPTINQVLTNSSNSISGTVQYVVTPTSVTGTCAGIPYTITVTVNPDPTVTNTATAIICSGTSPNISLTSSIPSTFTWTIGTITGGITGASSGSGSTIDQVLTNPSNVLAGSVEYQVTPTSVTGTCAGTPYTITVTVNPAPAVTNAVTSTICSGTSPNFALTASVPSTFTWTIGTITGGITGASSGSGSVINQTLTNPSNSISGTVQYLVRPTSVTGTCAGTPYTITVTVNPAPAVTNPATASICSGKSPNISLTSSVPCNFAWTIGTITGGITGASSGSGPTINQVLTNSSNSISGTVQYVVTPTSVTGTCAGIPYTITVTVNPDPTVTNTATAIICSGTSPNISLTSSIPSTFTWTIGTITGGITGASSGSGSTIDQVLTNPSNVLAGSVEYQVTPTSVTGTCAGTPYTITVTVNPAPAVTNAVTSTICSGTSPNFALTASIPSTFTWTIGTITGGITGASSGSGSVINQTLTNPSNPIAGSVQYIVTPRAIAGSCAGTPSIITVIVNPTPVVTNPATVSICSGTNPNISLTASAPSSFSWTIGTITGGITGASPGSGSAINQTLTNSSNTVAGSVEYIVTPTATSGSCIGASKTITVTVNPLPVMTSLGSVSICNGTSPNIVLAASSPSTYTWTTGTITGGITGASSGSGSTINQILTNPSNSSSGTVNYVVTPTSVSGSCTGISYTIVVTVDPSPILLTPNTTTICSGSGTDIILTASSPSTYTWTVGTITGGITGASAGSGSTINQILTNPSNAFAGTVQYLITPTSAAGSCGTFSVTVTVNPKPIVTNAHTATICSGTSTDIPLTSSVPSNFTWTIGTITGGISGASAGSGTNISQILTNPSNTTAGTVQYLVTPTGTSGSCVSTPYSITVTVNPVPVVTNTPTLTICNGASLNIVLTASSSSTFSWTIGANTGGITGVSSGSGPVINQILTNPSSTTAGTVQYLVTPTSTTGSCAGIPYAITVTVNPASVVTNPATASTCSGTSPNINLTANFASTFTWTIGTITGGITGASTGSGPIISQVLTNPSNTTPGTVQYIVTPTAISGSCTSTPYTITVTVYPKPIVTSAPTAITCSGTDPNIVLTASFASNFSWTIGTITGGITGASAGSGSRINQVLTNPSNTVSGTVAYIITPTSIAGSCTGNPFTVTVTVNPAPTVTTLATLSTCSGTSSNINLTASVVSNFTWTIGANTGGITGASSGPGSVINQVLINPSTTAPGSVEYLVTPTSTTGSCAGATYSITETVNPAPAVTIPATATICSGTSPNISLTASLPSNFSWTVGVISGGITGANAGSGTAINQVLTNPSSTAAGTVAYIVTPTATSGSCIGAPYTITVTILPKPTINNAPAVSICSGTNPGIGLTASVPSSFTWTVGAVTGGITGASAGSGPTINQILTNPGNTAAGTVAYIVTPTSTTGSCVGTPFTITVTVNPTPVVTTLNTATICSGTSPSVGLTASVPSSFTWTIGTISGGISGANAGSGATINQILTNPSTTLSGTVEYLVTPTAITGSCAGAPYVITVTVNPTSVVTTADKVTVCSGTSPNISLTASVPSTFTWTVGAITGGVTGASAGTGLSINQTLTNPSNTVPGTVAYIVTPTASTGSCSGIPYTIIVTVQPAPVMTTANTAMICNGTSPNINLTASLPSNFTWTIGTITGGISGATANSGTIINQVLTNPSNAVAGTVAYIVTPTSTAGSCVGAPYTITITVNTAPIVTTASTATICSGTSPNIGLTASMPSSFSWTIGTITGGVTGASAGSGSTINQILTNPSNLSAGSVDYIVRPTSTAGSCVGTTYVITVTVNPAPAVITPATAAICSGTSPNINLSASMLSTYTWTVGTITGGITGASVGSGNIINQTLINPGNSAAGTVAYLVTPTASAGSCIGIPYTITVTVYPKPVVTNIPSVNVCSGSGSNINLTASVPSSFTWTVGAITGGVTGASAGSGPTINQILTNPGNTAAGTVAYIVTPTSTTGSCVGTPFTITATVNPTPVVTTLNTATICSGTGSNIGLTASVPSSFTWTIGTISGGITGASAGSGATISQILTNPSATLSGTVEYLVTPKATTGSCSGATYVITVTVNPALVITTANTATICNGTSPNISLTASVPSTFTWTVGAIIGGVTGASAGTGLSINQTLTNPSNTVAGTVAYIVTPSASAGSCSGTPYTITVTVKPTPVLISGLSAPAICSNSLFSYNPISSAPNTTFNWTRAAVPGVNSTASGTGNPNETLVNTSNIPVNVTYVYTLTANGCTNPTTFNVVVTVNPLPSLSSTLTPAPICSNSVFTYTPTSSDGIVTGWTRMAVAGISNPAASGTANPNELLINTTASPVNVTYVYTVSLGGCSNLQNVVVTVNPSPVLLGSLTPSAICSNSVFSYVPASSTTGATFNWFRNPVAGISNLAASGIGNPNESLINTSSAAIPVTYTYQVAANGCNSTQNVVVSVKPLPVLTSSLTPPAICSNTPFIYTPQSNTAGAIFSWSRPSVADIANPAATGFGNPNETLLNLTNASIPVTYIYTLSANGCTNPITFSVVVNVNPTLSLSSSLTPPGTCSGSIFNYSAKSTPAGAVMTWTRATVSGIVQSASGGTGDISEFLTNSTAAPINVTYQYSVSANSCTNIQNVVVRVNPAPVLSSSQTPPAICSGTVFHYAATSATTGTVFTWARAAIPGISQPASAGTGDVNETLTNTTNAPVVVTYSFSLTANGCTGTTYDIKVTVNPTPQVPVITPPGPVSFCAGGNVILSAPSGYSSYLWSNGASAQNITVTTAGSYSVIVKDGNGCQSASSVPVTTTILPSATVYAGSDGLICAGSNFSITGASASNYSSFVWSSSGTGTFISNTTLAPTYVPSAADQTAGVVTLILTAYSITPCTGTVHDDLLLTIRPLPTVNAGADKIVCYPATILVTGTATYYQNPVWTHNGTGTLTGGSSLTPTYHPGAADVGNIVKLTLSVDALNPCSSTITDFMLLQVDALPGNPGTISGPAGSRCKGTTATYSVLPISGATDYNWSLPTGITILSGANSNTINVSFGADAVSGNITIYASNNCGNSTVSSLPVVVTDIPSNPGSISGNPSVCQGTTGEVFSITPGTGITSYTWTVPSGATITSVPPLGNSITVDFGLASIDGNVTVYTTNACGDGPVVTKAIKVNIKPATPVITATGGPTTFCEGGSIRLQGPTNGFNYLWSPGGATTQTNDVTTSGNYSVVITDPLTGCSSAASNIIPVVVNPAPAAPASSGFITQCLNGGAVPVLNATTNATAPAGYNNYLVRCCGWR